MYIQNKYFTTEIWGTTKKISRLLLGWLNPSQNSICGAQPWPNREKWTAWVHTLKGRSLKKKQNMWSKQRKQINLDNI